MADAGTPVVAAVGTPKRAIRFPFARFTAIELLFKGREKFGHGGGPGKSTVEMDGSQWIPYQPATFPTPPLSGLRLRPLSTTVLPQLVSLNCGRAATHFGHSVHPWRQAALRSRPGVTPAQSLTIEMGRPSPMLRGRSGAMSRRLVVVSISARRADPWPVRKTGSPGGRTLYGPKAQNLFRRPPISVRYPVGRHRRGPQSLRTWKNRDRLPRKQFH